MIPGVPAESTQFATLVALFAGVMTLIEYSSRTPVLIEFRDAPPYNKIRLLMLAVLVASLTAFMIGTAHSAAIPQAIFHMGTQVGSVLDVPYSPVRLMIQMLPDTMSSSAVDLMRAATALALAVAIIMITFAVLYFRGLGWPNRKTAFNVHTNLPMFDPTTGGDVVIRLKRGARINIFVGLLVPFI
ncbi:MAG: hypothetical protein ACPGRD_11610, partial [Planktomarina sp.]